MNQLFNDERKRKYIVGFSISFLFPLQALADGGFLDRLDNIPPRAWIGRPVASGPVVDGTVDISSGKEVIYRTFFNEQLQIGDIIYEDAKLTGDNPTYNNLPGWRSPAALLSLRSYTSRKIYTRNNETNKGVPFVHGNLSASQKDSLKGAVRSGEEVVNYTRGQRVNEVPEGSFRSRVGLLGEINGSNLFLVNHVTPPGGSATEPYPVLYVGANDGMLHAFDAKTGDELFAYVPSAVIGNLRENAQLRLLPDGVDVLAPKPAYVDGQIAVGALRKPGSSATDEAVLVGTLGAGGSGLYALNITDPKGKNFGNNDLARADNLVKWEIKRDNGDFKNMGNIFGAARIITVKYGGSNRQVVILGNGYYHEGAGVVSLFVIDLDTGNKLKEIVASSRGFVETITNATRGYGLSTPTPLDSTGDGVVDYAYAGDSTGRLWKFDLTNLSSEKSPADPVMLYHAKLREGEVWDSQIGAPISTPPVIHYNKDIDKHMIIFGTGLMTRPIHHIRYLNNSIYGIVDEGKTVRDEDLNLVALRDGFQAFENYRISLDAKRRNGSKGWFMHLMRGDRIVGFLPVAKSGNLYVTTNAATLSNVLDPSWFHVIDMNTGLAPKGCSVFDRDGDGKTCIKVSNEDQPDPDDLLPLQAIMGTFRDLIGTTREPSPRDRTLMALKIEKGAVSQPILLSNGNGLVTPVFNWNSTGLQRTIDLTRKTLIDVFKGVLRDIYFESRIDSDGDTVLAIKVDRERREDRAMEEIKIKKDGSWHYRDKRRGINSDFTNWECIANCDQGYFDGKRIAGLIKGTKVDPGIGEELPELKRKSWRVLEE